jgi:hypothetical protein
MPLQLTKKRDAAPASPPAWHPNFRDFERLPDTSAIRKTFFVNATAVLFAVLAAGWLAWNEFQVRNYATQQAAAEAEIARHQKQNAEGLKLTKEFADEEKKFTEAAAFLKAPIRPSELLLLLGETLPAEIQLEYVDLRLADPSNSTCILRGYAAGSKDQASGAASAYVERLRTVPRFAQIFESVNLTTLNTDARTGMLIFEIVLKFKGDGKGTKK